jgi:hypothetical protein
MATRQLWKLTQLIQVHLQPSWSLPQPFVWEAFSFSENVQPIDLPVVQKLVSLYFLISEECTRKEGRLNLR